MKPWDRDVCATLHRKDGKTVCRDTFAGYTCECGSGFISRKDAKSGEDVCLDINECLATDPGQLDADCTCARCACQNVFGGYKCVLSLNKFPCLSASSPFPNSPPSLYVASRVWAPTLK